ASSAARFIDKMVLSTNWPIPILRNAVSTFLASGGRRIFSRAFPKKPFSTESLPEAFFAPIVRASLRPLTISPLLRFPNDDPDPAVLPERFFLTLFHRSLID